MTTTLDQLGIAEMTVSERLELIGLIWDSITDAEPGALIPVWHQRELERRRAAAVADPGAGVPWIEVKARLLESS